MIASYLSESTLLPPLVNRFHVFILGVTTVMAQKAGERKRQVQGEGCPGD